MFAPSVVSCSGHHRGSYCSPKTLLKATWKVISTSHNTTLQVFYELVKLWLTYLRKNINGATRITAFLYTCASVNQSSTVTGNMAPRSLS